MSQEHGREAGECCEMRSFGRDMAYTFQLTAAVLTCTSSRRKVLAWGGAPMAPPLAVALSGVDGLLEEGEPRSCRSVSLNIPQVDNLSTMHILASVRLNK